MLIVKSDPLRFQPRGMVEINDGHPLARNLVGCMIPSMPRGLFSGIPFVRNGAIQIKPAPFDGGLAVTPAGINSTDNVVVDGPSHTIDAARGFALFVETGLEAASATVDVVAGFWNSGYTRAIQVRPAGSQWRGALHNISGTIVTTSTTSAPAKTVGERMRATVSYSNVNAGSELRAYFNAQGPFTASLASPHTTAMDRFVIGGVSGSNGNRYGTTIAAAWARALSQDEHEALVDNPWQFLRAYQRRIYVPTGAGPVSLLINDGAHAHAADAVLLSQVHGLSLADSAHTHTADNLTLSGAALLVLSDGAHGHTAESLTLSQVHTLALADATHAHSVQNVVLAAAGTLDVAAGMHGHLADGLALTQLHVLLVASGVHAHSADALNLSGAADLVLAGGAHAHQAQGFTLTQAHALAVANAMHAHGADELNLSGAYVLAIANAVHEQLAGTPALTQQHILVVSDALHEHFAQQVAYGNVLTTTDSRVLIVPLEERVLVIARSSAVH